VKAGGGRRAAARRVRAGGGAGVASFAIFVFFSPLLFLFVWFVVLLAEMVVRKLSGVLMCAILIAV
jgi:hypothetical protein